ncbi:MAG: hypothetical protein QNJ78_06205 [Gammaproteobacteria bacterium]|nr:hypothetical protein [Gammaproteobacteria bacterium]
MVVDHPIAYVKRPVPMVTVDGVETVEDTDLRVSQVFQAGADLYLRDRASPSAEEQNLTSGITRGAGDVRDVSVSHDGSKLLFALRLPEIENADPEDQPTWNIWEYDIPGSRLRRIIPSDIAAEEGQDRFPQYLPDGRIVFSSTRQRQAKARLLDEGKPQYPAFETSVDEAAMVLHVMQDDGSEIKQISFNKSHDFSPALLSNGQIIYSRWDNFDGRNAISLYRMNPDGTEHQLLYGVTSHATGTDGSLVQFMQPREMPDGQLLVMLIPFNATHGGGDLVIIDIENYVENDQPTWVNQGLPGPAQLSATVHEVSTDGSPSPGGRFNSAYPLQDGTDRLLVSWSQCRLVENGGFVPCTDERLTDPDAIEAPPIYGIFIYDMQEATQLPIVTPQEHVIYSDLVVAQPVELRPIIFDQDDGDDPGVLHIRSVYDVDGEDLATDVDGNPTSVTVLTAATADQRPARFLRILKKVTIPDRDVLDFPNTAYGRTQAFGMREVVGYAPIEADGSVKVKVPTNVPITFSVLDLNGRRTNQTHEYSLQFRPGEVVECHGCHDPQNNLPHGRLEATPPSIITGDTLADISWPDGRLPTMDLADAEGVEALYDDLDPSLTLPLSHSGCNTAWDNLCRAIIHYEQHIHPLWALPRTDASLVDVTCINCHDRDDAGTIVLPAGQLELTDESSLDEPDHLLAYRELLFPDNLLIIDVDDQDGDGDTTELVELLVQATDADGNPLYELDENGDPILDQPIMIPVPAQGPSMRAGSANGGYFLSLFDSGGIHEGYLSAAEKKLIAEWLDIGAQYYNNPFDVPLDD